MQRLNERATGRWAVLVGCCVTACSLDVRTLHHDGAGSSGTGNHPGSSGSGAGMVGTSAGTGTGADSAGGTGGTQGMGSNGGGGSGSGLPPLVDGCADLDSDGVADCKVTLLKNSAFASDVADWTGVDGATLTWDPDNALADKPSGCGRLRAPETGNDVIYRASQCVEVASNTIVVAYANARVDQGPAGTPMAHAELEVSFFDNPDCSAKSSSYFTTPLSEGSRYWEIIQAGGVSSPTTASVSVALVGVRPDPTNQQSICFDNLMVKALPLSAP